MKRHLIRIAIIGCLIVTLLTWGGAAYAQDDDLTSPGMTPDSPFYFLDNWGKHIAMFFTFGEEAKARRALKYAEERLSEANTMANREKFQAMITAMNGYDDFINAVQNRMENMNEDDASDNLSELLARNTYRFQDRLNYLKDKLAAANSDNATPNGDQDRDREKLRIKAHEAIQNADNTTVNCQVKAIRRLAKNRPGTALEISSETVDGLMERVRARIADGVTDNNSDRINECLNYAAKIAELEDEMTALAEAKGIDITQLQQHLAQSTSNRLQVLSGVYQEAPPAALNGLENAMENSVDKHNRVLERLRERNVTSNVTIDVNTLDHLPQQIRDRLHEKVNADLKSTTEETTVQLQTQEQVKIKGNAVSANQTQEHQQIRDRDRVSQD